jgi:predicted signal transduction protein with EAL and GGDEF domain
MGNPSHNRAEDTAGDHYDVRVWTFAKGGDELTVEQWVEGETVVVTLTRVSETGAETVHGYEFSNQSAAEQFHANLDKAMLEFGWSFVGYLPQRRTHDDRRQRVRASDRRRWWTDGALILDGAPTSLWAVQPVGSAFLNFSSGRGRDPRSKP